MATTRDILEGRLVIAHNGLLEAEEPHEHHGHPPLADPGTEFWMKWDEWNLDLMEMNQYNQIEQFETVVKPGLEWFSENSKRMRLDLPTISFPECPPEDAPYDQRQSYLVDSFEAALHIALPKQPDPVPVKQCFVQTSLDQYRVLYQCSKLGSDPSIIRLLEIFPGSSLSSPIEARLFNTSLESPGLSYEALSYVWGSVPDPQQWGSIRVNGLMQRVAPNLQNALSSLRLADRSRVLWVDSICINQGDLEERARQVVLMARIFAKAERTVVYLGPSTPASTALFRFLSLPLCDRSVCPDCGVDRTLLQKLHRPLEACTTAALEESEVLDGFIDICRREWWDRVWILQEFTLSKQDPTFYCGRDVVSNRLLSRNFYKIYDWVAHRKKHPTRLGACEHWACNENDPTRDNNSELNKGDSDEERRMTIIRGSHDHKEHELVNGTGPVQIDEQSHAKGSENPDENIQDGTNVVEAAVEEWEPPEVERKLSKPIEIPQQSQWGREWSSWGVSAWKASSVLQRRSTCRPWQSPDYIYKFLRARCSDPRDIVYGVRELMEPAFREIFNPDYTIPIPKLYTKLSAYMLLFHSWSDMFFYYPHRLLLDSSKSRSASYTPSWVPDFSMPVEIKEAERRPPRGEMTITSVLDCPHILGRVLFMSGLLLDEIVHVFPLPKNDPFKVLQQLWYLERLYGRPAYNLIDNDLPSESNCDWDSFNTLAREEGGISSYPSIAWATRYSDDLPHDISIIHIISKTADFANLSMAMRKCLDMITVCLDRQFEKEGKKRGPRASQAERDEYWKRDGEIIGRLNLLVRPLLKEKWLDFVGICTFDFESLRAQVMHHLVPMVAWEPSRLSGSRILDKEELHICDPPFTSAVFQRPVRYSSLLRAIAKDVESEDELKMRRDAVILLAETVHDATASVVGGQSEVDYTRLNGQKANGGTDRENSNTPRHFDSNANDTNYDDIDGVGGTIEPIITEFVMIPLPEDVATGDYTDTPIVVFPTPEEDVHGVNRIDSYLKKTTKAPNLDTILEERYEEDCVVSTSSESASDLGDAESKDTDSDIGPNSTEKFEQGGESYIECKAPRIKKPSEALRGGTNDKHDGVEESLPRNIPVYSTSTDLPLSASILEGQPNGKMSRWRRTETRTSNDVHLLLKEVVDFLSGREHASVRDGDDILLLKGMSFPLIARLEPSKELGNPKKRRTEVSTKGMRREILGTAIVRDINANSGSLDEAQIPTWFEPLSGFTAGLFRFK
ncbi:hypothetical protein EKO27_g5528 [Xylaria grammica]|uniref:Heterokaryon incompatibility domain-containing protein n=1 Tax=Xylaria grammica TaxID=363999 RepID=A0A439D5C0_9PEZI|nr:hypothetical protein EKO27_g5528 [Xylaria grammica]